MKTNTDTPAGSTPLEKTGRQYTQVVAESKALRVQRRELLARGYALGVVPGMLSKAAGVQPAFIRQELGGAPKAGDGSLKEQMELLSTLNDVAEQLSALQKREKELRREIDTLIGERIAQRENSTSPVLAAESGLSVPTVDRIRKALKSA